MNRLLAAWLAAASLARVNCGIEAINRTRSVGRLVSLFLPGGDRAIRPQMLNMPDFEASLGGFCWLQP
jgi:hypothetical protein